MDHPEWDPERDYFAPCEKMAKGWAPFTVGSLRERTLVSRDDGRWVEVPSRGLASRIRAQGDLRLEDVHSLAFLGFLACRHGVACGESLLCDTGLVHDAIHAVLGTPVEYDLQRFCARIETLELALLRYYPEGIRV